MPFDIDRLTMCCIKQIREFGESHQNETFYAFAIDADMLCINSVEQFEKMLNEFEKQGNKVEDPEVLKEIRSNTGDWIYQGFASLGKEDGFDSAAYDAHYNMSDEEQKISEYGRAMDKLVSNLKESGIFDELKTTNDFYAERVEHNY